MPMRQNWIVRNCAAECGGEHPDVEEGIPGAKTYEDGAPVPDHGWGVFWCGEGCPGMENGSAVVKGNMPPCIDHMELLAWMQRADFSEHIQRFKLHGNPLNSPHFDAPNTKFAPTGYRRAPNIISHHYKQQLSAKASIIPKARPIRFR